MLKGLKYVPKNIPLRNIRMDPKSWERETTDEDIDDLAGSYEDIGQINRITVRPLGKAGRMFSLIAGRRRYMALKKLGTEEARCEVVKCDDVQAEMLSLIENLKIKKPNSKEWASGAKRLRDLIAPRLKEEEAAKRRKEERLAKEKKRETEKGGDLLDTVSKKSKIKTGRPKEPKTEANKQVASALGVSERTVRKALKREDDLISSAHTAWKTGRISDHQADLLAAMPMSRQIDQLPLMVHEKREETRQRLAEEKTTTASDKETKTVIASIKRLQKDANSVAANVRNLLDYCSSREIAWDEVLAAADPDFLDAAGALRELQEYLES